MLRTFLCFGVFFVGFFAAETLRFDRFIYREDHSFGLVALLILIAAVSGAALAIGLAALDLFPKTTWKKITYGSGLGIVFFFVIFGAEDLMSYERLYSDPNPASFSEVKGHCGIYAGRALLEVMHWDWNPSLRSILDDFKITNRCRIQHFLRLSKEKQLGCGPAEDPVRCRVRWMEIFAQRGYWNAETRRMFLNEMRSFGQVPADSMIAYALKDYELDTARPGILKQAGLDEQLTDPYLYYKQAEELENVNLTKEVFDSVASMLSSGSDEDPMVLKFRDAQREVALKVGKIPEMQKDLDELKQRIQL